MSPWKMMAIAILLPLGMMILLIAPLYAGAYGGLMALYGEDVSDSAIHPDYQLATYEALFQFWQTHSAQVGFFDFILPAFGPLLLGVVLGIAFFVMFLRYVRRVFVL
ncbi:MAG: hypothetical protein K2Q12_04340 [Rickettsiales bacterium]|nr:hypothetical protein [Rickettsiales bacterium]